MKKYQKITLEDADIIGKYVDKAVTALLEDKDLRIINVLLNLKNSILANSIELKDKKKEKTIEIIDRIDNQILENFLKDRENILKKKSEMNEQMDKNTSLASIKELEYKIEHVSSVIEKLKKDIEEKTDLLQKIDLDNIKKN